MNYRRRDAPSAAQDSSYVGEEGEKRGTSISSSATWPASASWPSVCLMLRHLTVSMLYLIAHQYLSQDMDCVKALGNICLSEDIVRRTLYLKNPSDICKPLYKDL